MKKLLLSLLFFAPPVFAQKNVNFPESIENYQKKDSNETTLQLVLFDTNKLKNMQLSQQDLIEDANDLSNKIKMFFNQEYNVKKVKVDKSTKKNQGFLLITKYIFLGKDKPYTLIDNEDNEDLKKQVYKESQCQDGVCTSHIIMGINYFDTNYKIKPLDVKSFSKVLETKDDKYIKGNYNNSQEGVVKIYYFYGINGSILPKDKQIIKNMIIMSKK